MNPVHDVVDKRDLIQLRVLVDGSALGTRSRATGAVAFTLTVGTSRTVGLTRWGLLGLLNTTVIEIFRDVVAEVAGILHENPFLVDFNGLNLDLVVLDFSVRLLGWQPIDLDS